MVSILKTLGRPRFGLVVVMLFLVAGLFPQKTIAGADDQYTEPPIRPTTPPPVIPPTPMAPTPVKCWEQSCNNPDVCLRKPVEPGPIHPSSRQATTIDCPNRYCYQEFADYDGGIGWVWRGCASNDVIACLNKAAGGCVRTNYFLKDEKKEKEENEAFHACLRRKPEERKWLKVIKCICDTDHCNEDDTNKRERPTTSSGPTGVKYLGYKITFVGALMNTVLPLRTAMSVAG